jgi:hypothetical protein
MGDSEREVPVPEDTKMGVTDVYSYHNAVEVFQEEYEEELNDIFEVIERIPAKSIFVKDSNESQYSDIFLASPVTMNHMILIEGLYEEKDWSVDHGAARGKKYIEERGKEPKSVSNSECALDIAQDQRWGKRTVDAIKNRVAVEIQFGKYAFMMYDVLAKFGHFTRANRMDIGVELVPSNQLYQTMPSGPGYYEQLKTELEHLPNGYISEEHRIPVMVLGVGFERDSVSVDEIDSRAERYSKRKLSDY